jgi:uncharacterized protein (TIGR02145 family)
MEEIKNAETVTDIDGNVYTTVKIGRQVWTVENLKTANYNDNTAIPLVKDKDEWGKCELSNKAAYCWYNNNIAYKEKYGALYNWYAVNTGKLAPKGWHVPTDAEWDELQEYLIANGYNWDGTTEDNNIAKAMAAKTDWLADDYEGTIGNDLSKNNRSGFSALPGGCRYPIGFFDNQGEIVYWWSTMEYGSSDAYDRELNYNYSALTKLDYHKNSGFSVRLVRDY